MGTHTQSETIEREGSEIASKGPVFRDLHSFFLLYGLWKARRESQTAFFKGRPQASSDRTSNKNISNTQCQLVGSNIITLISTGEEDQRGEGGGGGKAMAEGGRVGSLFRAK